MEAAKLNAEVRSTRGGTANRKLRGTGKIPAVCYGAGDAPIALSIDPAALTKALDPVKGNNTLIHITVDGKSIPVMVKDVQRDALRGQTTHVDFIRVRTDQPVRVTVPINITGKAEGLKVGGTLHQVYRKLQIQCTPDKIPARIDIDVTALGLGQAIHVSDLKLGAGVQAVLARVVLKQVRCMHGHRTVQKERKLGELSGPDELGDVVEDLLRASNGEGRDEDLRPRFDGRFEDRSQLDQGLLHPPMIAVAVG